MGHPIGSFEITQPLEEHQQRLAVQRPKWRPPAPPHVPNVVPFMQRVILGIATITWGAWALIGLLSGHMYVLLSRRGPIHLSGVAAILFSLAVLIAAAGCLLHIVDHYDRRNNEDAYRAVRRKLWGSVAAIAIAALVVGCVGPAATGTAGLLDARAMDALTRSAALASWLSGYSGFNSVLLTASLWALVPVAILTAISRKSRKEPSPAASMALTYLVFAPCLVAFTMELLLWVCSGDAAASALRNGNAEARLAFAWSTLVICFGILLMLAAATPVALWRLLTGRLARAPSEAG
ncbi:MAG: hypothetical protein EOO30_07795 [Comamonadaceae bacterium]|nr:MAG: hypothetical protein EOO30_07795 [Comamonadaceae bacterium]